MDRAIEAWKLTLQAPSWGGTFVWTHGDLLPGNLLANNGELAAVVDFECLGIGDPALDLIGAWSVFDRAARDEFRSGVDVDDHTWMRAANLALRLIGGIRYYEYTNPSFSAMARRAVNEVINDLS